jgi:hypothetical protein
MLAVSPAPLRGVLACLIARADWVMNLCVGVPASGRGTGKGFFKGTGLASFFKGSSTKAQAGVRLRLLSSKLGTWKRHELQLLQFAMLLC